ncbi:DoxX family protein [Sediminicola sp. 1XM1-17]|uniref:DoxX family protein n=1 Tax=Sediminicola sp. 1XM1-17 TaxID=3127702 RepID=UPI003077B149
MDGLFFLTLFSSLSFLFFGVGCFFSPRMKLEFIRYGLNRQQRLLTGLLQILGSLGLLLGLFMSPILCLVASLGLFLLMLLGLMVRIRIKDSILKSSPALIYALINLFLASAYYGLIFMD